MSLKDLFESTKVTKSGSADETAYEVESEAYREAFTVDKDEYLPPVDFSTASNFARYGSAAKYYDDSIRRIYNDYPYDGSKFEVLDFHNSSSYLDRWMLEHKYPRTTGYVSLGTTSGSGDWLTMVSSSDEAVGGYGMPDTTNNNILEYIEIKGGPHTGSADRTFETQEVSLKKLFDFSNVYDSGSAREYNLEFDLGTGVTVEFWMLKNAFYASKTEREVVFDLWNHENSSSAGYGRLMIELSGGSDAGSSVRLTAQSGTTGFINEPIATITPSEIADGVWKHYAVTLKNAASDDGITAKLYVNGQLSGSSKLGSATLGRVTGSMNANIGALIAPPSGATGYYDSTTIAEGAAKLSASIDDFRYWKLERDARQVGRNWFTQIAGGTNTDEANVGLGVYYKFNEGIANSGSRDRTVLDYSGRISNGFWTGGVSAVRNSGSAMASGSHNMNEYHDPIIYSDHPLVDALKDDIIHSGTVWDNQNNSLITSNFPDWIDTESRDTTLKHMTQIMASYFDKLYLQIDGLGQIKERYAGSPPTGDVSASYKPLPFSKKLVSQFGIATPEILSEAELIETFLNRNEKQEYGEKLHDIRNQIYGNIYANLLYIFKTKGTEKSLRNMLRCFGIDDELVKINAYSDNSDYVFKDNRRSTTNRTNYVSFATTDRRLGTVYQAVSMSVDGIYDNPNARAYITGSSGSGDWGEFNAQTIECEVFFPLKPEKTDIAHWYQDSFFTASMFGAMGTVESQTDTRFPTNDPVDLRVFAIKDGLESTRAQFMVSSSMVPGGLILTSDHYEDVYDDTRWNFGVRVKPSKHPWVDHVSGTAAGDNMGPQTFDVEFYGVNVFTDVKQHEFLKTTTVTEAIGKSFLSSSKRCYVGALHENFTGSVLHQSNVEVGNLRYWLSDVSDEVLLTHAMDQSSFGVESPYKNTFIYQSSMSGTYVPQIETLALHWNFDNVTGSGNSPSDEAGTYDAQFIVQDVSSGSAEHGERYEPGFSDQVKMQHLGVGDFFLDNKTNIVNTRYVPTAKLVLPEYLHSSDMVEIRERDDEFFTRESRPSKVIYSIEKSMYQTISEEMIKMFATIKDFDNLIGEPINRYRHEYKNMAKLRQLFFEKMPNSPDLDKYVDYYKWIDSAVSRFLEDLMPASTMHSEGMQNMVESHILERSKYQTKYPSMNFEGDPPIGSVEGINKLLYDYKRGSAPLPSDIHPGESGSLKTDSRSGSAEMMDQDQNCLWWSKRADREHPILASTALSASSPGMNLSGTLTSRAGIFSASTSAFNRKLHTPYKYSIEESRLIHGGINFDRNKKLGYVYPATVPFSPRGVDYGKFGGYPLGYLLAKDMDRDASPSASLPNCDMPVSSSYGAKIKREGYKVIDGWEGFKSEAGSQAQVAPVAAVGYVTISDASALNADGTGTAFELTTTDGTVVTVSQHGSTTTSTDTNTPTYQRSTTASTVATRIATCLNAHGKLTATANTNVVTITQATGGNNGNRTIILTGSWGSKPGLTSVGIQGGADGITATPNWESGSYHHFRGNLVMPFNVISSSQHDVNAGYTAMINQDLTVFEGTGMGHSTDAGTYINKMRQGYGIYRTDSGDDADGSDTPTRMGGLGRGVNLVNLHTDTYGDDKETPLQGPFTEKYVGGRAYRHAPINDGTDTLSTRPEGWLVLISTAMSTSSGVLHASSGGVGLVGPDYPFPHGPFPFANDDAINWRPIGGRYYRDETAKRPVNIRNIQMTTQSATPTVIGAHRHDIIADDGDEIQDWTYNIYEQTAPGAAVTVIGNYTKNYEVVHTVGRSNQKPFLRDNQSVRNIEQTGSFAEAPSILRTAGNPDALGAGTGTNTDNPTTLGVTTHVETILTQKFRPSASSDAGGLGLWNPTDATNTVLQGARVIVAQISGGVGGANTGTASLDNYKILPTPDEHIYMDHTVQNRGTGSTNLDTIFANKFSAPGGPRNQSKGFLDLAAEEYSVYNAYPWRNLEVLGSSSGESGQISASIHDSEHHPRLGLQSLRRMAGGKFGLPTVTSGAAAGTYDTPAAWHKVHRNGLLDQRATTNHRAIGSAQSITLTGDPGTGRMLYITDPWGHQFTYTTATQQDGESFAAIPAMVVGMFATGSNNANRLATMHSLKRLLRYQISGASGDGSLTGHGGSVTIVEASNPYLTIDWDQAAQVIGNTGQDWGLHKQEPSIANKNWTNLSIATTREAVEPSLEYIEKRLYDNDYVTRPIPQNDYQYAWISASLAPSGANSTYHNLGHGYHMDGFNHPTPSGSRPVDPIIFISASEAGSALGTVNTHQSSADRHDRYFGIAAGGDSIHHREEQHIPNVHRLNLNIRESQNTWLTDNSGAVALGFFASGGILPANESHPIGHDTNNSRGGFAYSSHIANLHNYVNTAIQYGHGLREVHFGSAADNLTMFEGDGIGALSNIFVADKTEQLYLQGAFQSANANTDPAIYHNEPIRNDLLPIYWSGSTGPYMSGSHENVDYSIVDGAAVSTDHQHYAINQSVASIFNSLMWKRNGPYGYPTWKQIRGGEHILAQTMRKNNRYIIVDPQSERTVHPPPGFVGRSRTLNRMRGMDAVSEFRRLGHLNNSERTHKHYYVPVIDASAQTMLAALQKGLFQVTMQVGDGETRVAYTVKPEKMLYANVTHLNNLKNFPISKLNEDLGLRNYKSDRTAYHDLQEMYTEMIHLDGADAYTLADLTYRETIFPNPIHHGSQNFRQRAIYTVGYWADDGDAEMVDLTDESILQPFQDPKGRRTFFDRPDPRHPHGVWEFSRGPNASRGQIKGENDELADFYQLPIPSDLSEPIGGAQFAGPNTDLRDRDKIQLHISASIWPMDGSIKFDSIAAARTRGSTEAHVNNASFRASGSSALSGKAEQFASKANTIIWTHGAPGILQNQYTWFHNGMALGYEPTSISGSANVMGAGDDPAGHPTVHGYQGARNAVVSASVVSNSEFAAYIDAAGTRNEDHIRGLISERYVESTAAGMAFGPSYSRPHMMVGRDSYCSPSAGKAAYSRRFLFAGAGTDRSGHSLIGAESFGKGDGLDPIFTGLFHPWDGTGDAADWSTYNAVDYPQYFATVPFTSSIAPNFLAMGNRAISQLTRSIGHEVDGLYVSDWEWKAPAQSGKSPFYANYSDWFEELRGISQDRQVLPEYRISDRIPYFVLDKQGRFTTKDSQWLSIIGNPSSSQGSLTSSADVLGHGNAITSSFMSDYAVTAAPALLDAIKSDNAQIAEPYELTLTCDAILKFLPYQGFYPQLRTVDLCKQFVDSYDEHVSFESDMGVNDKPSSFVRVDSSGSINNPGANSNDLPDSWYGYSPFGPGGGILGVGSVEGIATAVIQFKDEMQVGSTSGHTTSTTHFELYDGTNRVAVRFSSVDTDGEAVAEGGIGLDGNPVGNYDGVAYSKIYTVNPLGLAWGTWFNETYWNALAFAGGVAHLASRGFLKMWPTKTIQYAPGRYEVHLQYNVLQGDAVTGDTALTTVAQAGTAGTAGNALRITPHRVATSTTSPADGVARAFTGGLTADISDLLRASFYSKEAFSSYNFALDEIFDPTNQRVGGSGVLSSTGMETHGRNSAAAKRPFYGPFMAPGILFNTIKSGIAVDYPVLNRKLATTASVDRDGGRNYQIMNEYFDQRLPFETLIEPERYLTNVPLVDMEPHPSASINVTASWDGNGDPLYKMMMHNFLAEIPNFYLANQSMQSFVSLPESDGGFGQVEAVVHNGNQVIPEYRMMVKLYKSQASIKPKLPPSASNHWANHRGALQPMKSIAHDGTYSGSLNFNGQYEPCYYTDQVGMHDFISAEGGSGPGHYMDIYQSPVGIDYTKQESMYPRPQSDAPETITMYSRPSAFGPPSAGGYAFMPELEYTFTGSEAAPMEMKYGSSAGFHVPGSSSVGKVADRINTTHGMKDGTTGYNAPFTPPYYDGQAWAFVTFKPTRTGKHYLDDIWSNTTVNFLRYEFDYVSGAYGDWGTIGPQGYAMNVNAMQIDAAVNIKGKTSIKEVTYDAITGLPVTVSDSLDTGARNSAWVIQTKLETPILHFGYGLTDNQSAITLSGSNSASCLVESNGYHHGYPGLCEPIGMWHQYGEIPSASQGVYLEVTDIPVSYLRHGTEMTIANPKWLHITGSPDWNAGSTANVIHHINAAGDKIYGAPDWDGHLTGSDFAMTPVTGANGVGFLKGMGYRFSGSFSGSEDAYVVGRATIDEPDRVRIGSLERGGRQQYMRWRLMSTGSLAGIIADRTHLQLISADDGTILDTTWGVVNNRSTVALPGLSGSGPAYERGYYITSQVTGSNIISGSHHAGGEGESKLPAQADLQTHLNRGYPGTSSARQRLMGIGKLTGSFGDGTGPIPYQNYYTQYAHAVPNNPNIDIQNLAVSYQSPLHKNKRGVIPEPPHFSNNISTGSFGDALGATYYPARTEVTRPDQLKDPSTSGTALPLQGKHVGFSYAAFGGSGSFAHLASGHHIGPTIGAAHPANCFTDADNSSNDNSPGSYPVSNSVGVGRAEIICGYTGSTGRYGYTADGVPRNPASFRNAQAGTSHELAPDYEEWNKSIDGPLSESNRSPHYANTNHAESMHTHGETSYRRWAWDYYGHFSGVTYTQAIPSEPTAAEALKSGVNGFHAHGASHAAGTLMTGLEDVYPLGMMGGSGSGVADDGSLHKMDPIKMWYTNPVHIANVRMQDNFARDHLIPYGAVTQIEGVLNGKLNSAICSPRTVPSGKFLPRQGLSALTKSLGSLVGFDSGAKKLGQLAETKTVKEAVIIMPYVMINNRRHFVELNRPQLDRYFGRGDFENTTYWAGLESGLDLTGAATSPVSGLQVNLGASILRQIRLMDEYVIPPHLDFTRAPTASPYAMYIFEYEHLFSAQDLSDMWQGLFPDSGKVMKQVSKQVTHKLNVLELLGAAADGGDKIPNQIRFMVFKVKQRAEINYYAKTASNLDDDRFKFKFKAQESRRGTEYSYNWPYDFFSLVETAKITLSVGLRNTRLVENIELQELNNRVTMEPVAESVVSVSTGSSLGSVSEDALRTARRRVSSESMAAATTARYGTSVSTTTPTGGGGGGTGGGGSASGDMGTGTGRGSGPGTTRGSY
jgi:hypothetical protein